MFMFKACGIVGWMTLYPSTKSRRWMKKASSTLHRTVARMKSGGYLAANTAPGLHPGYEENCKISIVGWMTLYPSAKSRLWMKKASATRPDPPYTEP